MAHLDPGRSFDSDPELYDRARPDYAAEAVRCALPGAPRRVLDLGAGTGKLTAALRAPGRVVIAVDPSPVMLERLRQRVPEAEVHQGAAEATGLPDADVDAVVVGSAFHWFIRPAADAEIARVLRPGGTAALLWNPLDPEQPLFTPFAELRRRLGLPGPEFDADVELDRRWFGPTTRTDFHHERLLTFDDYLGQLASRSYFLALPADERARTLQRARDFATPLVRDDRLTVAFRTTVLRAVRLAGPVGD